MTYKELKELKNDTTIVIMRPSGRNEVTLFKRYCLRVEAETLKAYYLLGIEQINLNAIRLAQKDDVDFYILNKRRIIDQIERELLDGIL